MGQVAEEFEETLAGIRARHRDHPRGELTALLLLAMEREQLVSVAYRDELIQRRLATLPLGAAEREIVRHGIAWAWKDEEMHAIYTRGLLLRLGGPSVRARPSRWSRSARRRTPAESADSSTSRFPCRTRSGKARGWRIAR